ncbi:MAG: RNA polymerase subunit sigma [Planctomycetota bacterium]|nr:RNA polymerase subunit sigma [Planctomycetota bacterium]
MSLAKNAPPGKWLGAFSIAATDLSLPALSGRVENRKEGEWMSSQASLSAQDCARKIQSSRHLVVLSGAGISTAAGVPDFRGPQGLYVTRAYDPETVFDIGYFDHDPSPFYKFSRDFLGLLGDLQPTFTHLFLARLEAAGQEVWVVTQNIDGLHQRAGSKHVLPVHGDYETAACRRCHQAFTGAELRQKLAEKPEAVPLCPACGGVIKPDVVFFGENVKHLAEADRLARRSDLMLVLGSSLQVYPAAALPGSAGGEVVVVNRGHSAIQSRAGTFIVDAGLDEYFQEVAAALDPSTQG